MSESGAAHGTAHLGGRTRQAVAYSVDGDLRYLSHRDTIRLFTRALVRADLPVAYSQGFNPHARLSLPFPRPTGIASDAERAVIAFARVVEPGETVRRLGAQVPDGIAIRQAWTLGPRARLVPRRARYHVCLPDANPGDLAASVEELLDTEALIVERRAGRDGTVRQTDVRPFIESVEVEATGISMWLRVTDHGTARPDEVCRGLGLVDEGINHRVRRMEIEWETT